MSPSPQLPFEMIPQAPHDSWCFAAVTASVWRYYTRRSALSMCDVVSRLRGEPCCDPTPARCEAPGSLERALLRFDVFDRAVPSSIPLGPNGQRTLVGEIDAGRPVCLGLHFGEFIHFCVVHGYLPGSRLVRVADSVYDSQIVEYQTLRDSYHEGGLWFATYLTKQPDADA